MDYAAEQILGTRLMECTPRERVRLARWLLETLEPKDFNYGEFESAQAVERYVKKARNALKGLAL